MFNNFAWRTGRSCVFKNFIHLVFVTKYRRNVFTKNMLIKLKFIFKETCEQMNGELLEFNGEDDHVHLLVICPPTIALSNFVSKLKGKSSYLLRKEFWNQIKTKLWGKKFWSSSYCIVSCGETSLETVKRYIENQRKPQKEKHIRQSIRFTGKKRNSKMQWLA
jgi:putative transposase